MATPTLRFPDRDPVAWMLRLLVVAVVPMAAHANGGSPLLVSGVLYVLCANLFIGLAEGTLVALIFRTQYLKTVGLLLAANYISAWLGGYVALIVVVDQIDVTLENLRPVFWSIAGLTYVLTLLIEFPFIAMALYRKKHWLRNAVIASMVVQTLSYTCLFNAAWGMSGKSLMSPSDIVPLASMELPGELALYYISDGDGDVYRRPLDSDEARKVFDLNAIAVDFGFGAPANCLACVASVDEPERVDLVASVMNEDYEVRVISVLKNFAPVASAAEVISDDDLKRSIGWENYGPVPKLGEASASPWEFNAGGYAVEGLRGTNEDTGAQVHFAVHTPVAEWPVRRAVQLPSDKVLFQLGKEYIFLFDPATEHCALVTKGYGPVVVLEDISSDATEPTP